MPKQSQFLDRWTRRMLQSMQPPGSKVASIATRQNSFGKNGRLLFKRIRNR
jgi:hypothetical protein